MDNKCPGLILVAVSTKERGLSYAFLPPNCELGYLAIEYHPTLETQKLSPEVASEHNRGWWTQSFLAQYEYFRGVPSPLGFPPCTPPFDISVCLVLHRGLLQLHNVAKPTARCTAKKNGKPTNWCCKPRRSCTGRQPHTCTQANAARASLLLSINGLHTTAGRMATHPREVQTILKKGNEVFLRERTDAKIVY